MPSDDGSTCIDGLRAGLCAGLSPEARTWLDAALAEAARARARAEAAPVGGPAAEGHRPGGPGPAGSTGAALSRSGPAPRLPIPAWELRFAAAGRHCGRRVPGPRGSGGAAGAREAAGAAAGTREAGGIPAGAGGGADAPTDPVAAHAPDPADAARILLLHAAGADAAAVERLYAHGSGAERRAVLFALPCLELGAEAVPLVEDALRANDTRLIVAAVGPYAARHLDAHAWRHAVLKCLFTGVRTAAVAGLEDRARGDTELARMLTDFADERTAAGRPIPPDLHHVLTLTGATDSTASPAARVLEES